MAQDNRTFAGRTITEEDIENIQWARETYPKLSRTELAGTICHIIDWLTPSGRAKIQQCAAMLEKLEKEGVIDLPPKQATSRRGSKSNKKKKPEEKIVINQDPVEGDIRELEPITLEIAYPGKALKRWRHYLNEFHILQDKRVFGSRLQYFIKSGERELGCMQFSASAWALEERDDWIGWTMDDKERLHLIVNNSRFLIFPWVKVKNLASKALSLCTKQLPRDWTNEYGYAPVLLETFVDMFQFTGTCYRAANWIYLGETKGSGRTRVKGTRLSPKDHYVYPLHRRFREYLKGEIPYPYQDPDS